MTSRPRTVPAYASPLRVGVSAQRTLSAMTTSMRSACLLSTTTSISCPVSVLSLIFSLSIAPLEAGQKSPCAQSLPRHGPGARRRASPARGQSLRVESRRGGQGLSTYRTIVTKRDTRAYTDAAIEEDHLERILSAGRMAGSAKNQQPLRFVVVRERAQAQALATAGDYTEPVRKAPLS